MNLAQRQNGDKRYVVRDATPADLDRVAEIKVSGWADTYAPLVPPGVLAPFLDVPEQARKLRLLLEMPGTLLLVAAAESEPPAGFALTHADRSPEPWMESLHVLRVARGSGIGTALVRATAHRLLERGYRSLAWGVVSGNDSAARFYEHHGAVKVGVEPVDWADGVSHTVYRWPDLTVWNES